MNDTDLYVSRINVVQSYYDWYHEAREFYKDCDAEMPSDWWNRWVKVLGLTAVERGNNTDKSLG